MEFSINARKRPKQNPKALPQRIDSQCSSSASLISLSSVESTGDDLKGKDEENATTLVSLIASMSKSLMGAGGLSLSNGIAQSGNAPEAMFAAILWICLLAVVFGFFCWLIAYLCEITKSTTYRGLWQSTVGHKGGLSVSLANTFKAALSNLAYATILSDTLQSLLLSAGYHVPRWVCLSFITFFGILPLCMLENLNWLAPFSIVGSAGIVFTAASMGIRYFDGSYREGGVFWEEIPTDQKPQFGSVNRSWSWAILPYVCMIYEAFVMHYNSARFYTSLRKRSLSKFAVATGCSFGLATLVYMALAGYGFLTFGAASKDFILNNYSPNDKLIMISRLAVGISTLASYPIVFMGVRDGCIDMLNMSADRQTSGQRKTFKLLILGLLTLTSIFVTELGLINVLGGGLVATMIVFVFPAMALRASDQSGHLLQVISICLAIFGFALGLFGAYTEVTNHVQIEK